jgi:hypothetical protein
MRFLFARVNRDRHNAFGWLTKAMATVHLAAGTMLVAGNG